MYPKMHIRLKHFKHNLNHMIQMLDEFQIALMVITKVFLADEKLIDIINASDAHIIGDSRLINLKKMKTDKRKALIRIPQISEIKDVIQYSNISLQSELETIDLLNQEASKKNIKHQIILMFDLGDLREGIYYDSNYLNQVEKILKMNHIELLGIGTNLTCYGGVMPSLKTYEKLEHIKNTIESHFDIKLSTISGGNSSSIMMLQQKKLPQYINELRIGEAIVLGRETAFGQPIHDMFDDVFTLEASIIELKIKPSYPEGDLGMDAFGKQVTFKDMGLMKRGILAIGRQDINPDHLIAPKGIHVIGASSDHLIVHIEDVDLEIGDTIEFKLTYGGILSLMTSPYVEKNYV